MSFEYLSSQFGINKWALILAVFWSLFWKGLALWKAARRGDRYWFLTILVFNLLGFLEMLYIFVVIPWVDARKKDSQNNFQN
jgi:hypothetical protein